MKTLHFEININATPEKIWTSLWDLENYKIWTRPFGEGSYYRAENFSEGNKIHFLMPSGDGMYSILEKIDEPRFIALKHIGEIKDFEEQPLKEEGTSGKQLFKTSGGSLKLENIIGDIDGKTSGGSIKAYNSRGIINLRTSGGSISLEDLEGEVAVSTSGGSIKGQQIKGILNARTSGGSIKFDDLACKVNASSSGGSVTIGIIELADEVQLSTSGGSVNLTLPMNASANLNLRGSKVNTSSLSNFNGSNSNGKLVGSINGGGVGIDASTSGNVNLSFR